MTTETLAILRGKIDRYEMLRRTTDGLFRWNIFTLAVAIIGAASIRRQAIQAGAVAEGLDGEGPRPAIFSSANR